MALNLSKSDPRSVAMMTLFEIVVEHRERVLDSVLVERCFECKDQQNQSAQYAIHEHSCEDPLIYHVQAVLQCLADTARDVIVDQFRGVPKSAPVQAICEDLIDEDVFEILLGEAGNEFLTYWERSRDN